MYLMNKVRQFNGRTIYEVVDYKISDPLKIKICSVDRKGLDKFLTADLKDFRDDKGLLVSSAELVTSKLFDEPEVDIVISNNLIALLIELIKVGAFFIPASQFKPDKDYKVEEVNSFSNIRVSSSSMYIGFSILHAGSWASSKILYVEDGKLKQKTFYVAVPEGVNVTSCRLKAAGHAKVNGKNCNFFEYNADLPIVGDMSPAIYLPVPLFNYLNLQYTRCINAIRFLNDLFEEKGIQSMTREYETPAPKRAVTVKPSIKNTSKQRRHELSHLFTFFSGTVDEFVHAYRLNTIEHYVFILLAKIKNLKTAEDLFNMMKLLSIHCGYFSLILMMLRGQVFERPDFFFPENFNQVIARGGGGGDDFTTTIEVTNY